MLAKRIIACLDIKDGRTVKGTHFLDLQDAGDPVELASRYCNQGVDELVFLDISATEEGRKTLAVLVKRIALTLNIPFTVGGGVTSVSDVGTLLEAGADKISINSAAVSHPTLIGDLANAFGTQCITLAIDAQLNRGKYIVYTHGGKQETEKELISWAREGESRGAGEILFTSMDRDGSRQGFDLIPTRLLAQVLNIPVIASGGAGGPAHFLDVFQKAEAEAALAAGIFHYGTVDIPSLKTFLKENGITVRQ